MARRRRSAADASGRHDVGAEMRASRVALEAQALVRREHLAALEKKCALLEEYFGYTLIGEPLSGEPRFSPRVKLPVG